MPYFKGINVHVTKENGDPLPEYGLQQFSRMKTTACHVEAKTGLRFCIRITPDKPFTSRDEVASGPAARTRNATRKPRNKNEVESGDPSEQNKEPFIDLKAANVTTNNNLIPTITVLASDQPSPPKPVPFDLIAKVYIDGREKSEQGCVLYLNESNPDYVPSMLLKYRFVDEGDGTIGRRIWVFTDVGIGAVSEMFGTLEMDKRETSATEGNEGLNDLDATLGKSALTGAGKIIVEIKRVTIRRNIPGWKPRFKAGEDEEFDDNASNFGKNVTHLTSVKDDGCGQRGGPTNRVLVDSLEPKDGFYARFEFLYISRVKLLALNMMDQNGEPVKRQDWAIASGVSAAGKKRSKDPFDDSSDKVGDLAAATRPFISVRKYSLPPSSRGTNIFGLSPSEGPSDGQMVSPLARSLPGSSNRGINIFALPKTASHADPFTTPQTGARRSSRLAKRSAT